MNNNQATSKQSIAHESAHLHVSGEAIYIDDIPELPGTLHATLGLSTVAHATLLIKWLLSVF